jgi:hypothetical protein
MGNDCGHDCRRLCRRLTEEARNSYHTVAYPCDRTIDDDADQHRDRLAVRQKLIGYFHSAFRRLPERSKDASPSARRRQG